MEIKAGIMLHQPIVADLAGDNRRPEIREATKYRDDLSFTEQEFSRRNGSGNVLYELVVEERPVSYGWVALGGTNVGILHDLQMRVPSHAVYIWDCATPPAYRGKGYFPALLRGLITAADANLALVAVDTNNDASRKALQKAGFEPLFTYLSVRLMGRVLFSLALTDGKLTRAQPQFEKISKN